jgi:hypothetical protein
VAVGFTPLGALQSIDELITGRDRITGEEASRALAAVGVVAGVFGLKGVIKGFSKVDDIVDGVADVARRTCCFVAGTLVMTEAGLRPIEEIEVGDRVLSRDEVSGETAFKPVMELIRRHDREIWELRLYVEDGSGTEELFETTDDHPWRTVDGLWMATAELAPGTHIERASGVAAVVVSSRKTGRTAPTFNLEVADFHSYFVGETGAWVHNENCILAVRQALLAALRARVDAVRALSVRTFEFNPRVIEQLKDARLGPLAGRISLDDLQGLANNPSARRVFDARTGNINVIQEIEGRLIRITVPRDNAFKPTCRSNVDDLDHSVTIVGRLVGFARPGADRLPQYPGT